MISTIDLTNLAYVLSIMYLTLESDTVSGRSMIIKILSSTFLNRRISCIRLTGTTIKTTVTEVTSTQSSVGPTGATGATTSSQASKKEQVLIIFPTARTDKIRISIQLQSTHF